MSAGPISYANLRLESKVWKQGSKLFALILHEMQKRGGLWPIRLWKLANSSWDKLPLKLNRTGFKSTNFAEKGQPTRASDFRRDKFSQATKMMRTVSNYVVYYRPQSFSFEPGIVPHRNSER